MSSIPLMFFFENKLHRRRKIVKSENALRAWCYQDEEYVSIYLPLLRKTFKRAYTIPQVARLLRTNRRTLETLIEKGLIDAPEYSYEFLNGTYDLQQRFFNQDDLLNIRQAVWDSLRKNRFGEPYQDVLISADELEHKIALGDDRQFFHKDDGSIIKIYQT